MTKIIIEDSLVNDIPILSIYQSELNKYPLIFYLHGYGGDREQAIDFGYMLAKKGFYYVSMDCKEHGKRETRNENNKFSEVFPPNTGLDTYVHMHEIIEQSAIDIQSLIEYYKSRNEIDSSKIGITGFSMGGYASFYIAANNPNIKVAVPIAGKPAFTKAWKDSILSTGTYKQWSEQIQNAEKEIAKRTEYFQRIDPYEKMSNFSPKPLLIINGDQDTDSLFIYSLELYKKLLPLYAEHPENLQLWMPFADHQFAYRMKLKVCNWFEKHLGSH
ncbi:prolyl oligopeptidase family serine peptidase [Ornithinibacillus sp. L9]|uniref:Prolyl oligopeptidase family serine peptidase n=1 Tax=Ornithinibacillus caprae TaxID=2678566 RepID=A0A6N8FIP9_9BACI|nr:alpha/beta fold hydrolase [Ornithinibacillus caprae]MUK87847.1 prolyl oligopeptidase family serine peptidase [Ornithinibacillus caprae]